MRNGVRRAARAALGLAALAVLAGCGAKQDIFAGKGEAADDINKLQIPVFLVAGLVGVVVFAAIGYAVWTFRDRPGRAIPSQSHGNQAVEIGLTALSALILLPIAVFTVATVFSLAKDPGDDALVVRVTGQQWWWEYTYPSIAGPSGRPLQTSGELVLPVGQKIKLEITSRDVIHSFWIPALNGKKDAVPGRVHPLWLQADQPGMFYGQCTEFCGLSHANMRQLAIALNPTDFDAWVAGQQKPSTKPADAASAVGVGYASAGARCVSCHQIDGFVDDKGAQVDAKADEVLVAGVAPNLTHLMSRAFFAGANVSLRSEECQRRLEDASPEAFGAEYLRGIDSPECLNRTALEQWLRDPSSVKAMAPDPGPDGKGRGMPTLGLTEPQIDELIAYLSTLS
jgi:cytochrome c oxidase subunit 2